MSHLRTLVLLGSAVALAACSGATDVASPGDGVIVFPPPAPPVTPPPVVPPITPPVTPVPTSCPGGTTDVGTITAGTGQELRNCQLSGVITTNTALPNVANLVYSLNGGVRIGRDIGAGGALPGGTQAVLTIDPGVVVFGSSGSDFLLIERGSRLIAEGTANRPIVFTSRQNVTGTATESAIGQWGGIVLLGRAPISRCLAQGAVGGTVNCENRVEGADGLYGGATAADSSGSLRYVQVRYPGFEVTPGNELNGITMAGVGTGTSIQYVQVHNSSDDGIEWFGGGVNGRYLVLTGIDDDSLDTDFGYRGANQFVLVTQRALSTASNHIIEADTSGNDPLRPRSRPNFSNLTAVARNSNAANQSNALMFRGGTDYNIVNSVVEGLASCVEVREAATLRAADATLDETGPVNIRSTFLQCTAGAAFGVAPVTTPEVTSLLSEAGRNNVLAGTGGLASGFFPAAPVLAVTPVQASSINSFFSNTSYIGAFRDANDTWFAGWTCSSAAAAFAPLGVTACTASPLPIRP